MHMTISEKDSMGIHTILTSESNTWCELNASMHQCLVPWLSHLSAVSSHTSSIGLLGKRYCLRFKFPEGDGIRRRLSIEGINALSHQGTQDYTRHLGTPQRQRDTEQKVAEQLRVLACSLRAGMEFIFRPRVMNL